MYEMRKRVRLVVVLVTTAPLFVSGSARALDDWLILSEGATTCGEFIAQPGMQTVRMEWVLGYISGRNREAISPRERMIGSSFQQPAAVLGWLQSYCQFHSLDTLAKAADNLRSDFQRHEGH